MTLDYKASDIAPVTRAGRRMVGQYALPERVAAVERAERERVLAIAARVLRSTQVDLLRAVLEEER